MGGSTSGSHDEDDARLYVYTPTADTWDTPIDTPVYLFGLVVYRSQLVLVGGRERKCKTNNNITNNLLTLNGEDGWQETLHLSPMKTKRYSVCATSFLDYLLVAGGCIWHQGSVNTVEVFDGNHWLFARSLPKKYDCLKSVILDHCWYLMGGCVDLVTWNTTVHYAPLEALFSSCRSSQTSQPSSDVWKTLTNTPNPASGATIFYGRLIVVGGGEEKDDLTSTIHTYFKNTWIHVGDMPSRLSQTCSVVLPGTGELLVVGGYNGEDLTDTVLKGSIKGNLC